MDYDPQSPLAPDAWTRTEMFERLDAIVRFHGGPGNDPAAATIHGWLHLLAENQIADGQLVSTTKLQALVRSGLSRHEAVHAIGHAIMTGPEPEQEANPPDDLPDDVPWISPQRQARQDEAIAAVSADGWHDEIAEQYVASASAWVDEFAQGALAQELRRRIVEIERHLGEDGVTPRLAIVEGALAGQIDGVHVDQAIELLAEIGDPRGLAMLVRVAVARAGQPLSDHAILALRGRGGGVVEPALAALAGPGPGPVGGRGAALQVLSECGVRDDRILDALVAELPRVPGLTADQLTAYGDRRALPFLHDALMAVGADPDPEPARELPDIADAITRLGGLLTPEEQRLLVQRRLAVSQAPDLV